MNSLCLDVRSSMRQKEQMSLNWDILFNIALSLGRGNDLVCLMQTCHTLYNIGVPLLLDQTIELGADIKKSMSFCSFIFRDPGRALRVHDLRLCAILLGDFYPETHPDVSSAVGTVLHLCRNVKHLDLPDSEALALCRDLAPAVASFRHLERISIMEASDKAILLLMRIRSPIATAHVQLNVDVFPEDEDYGNPVFFFQHLKDHLVDVRLTNFERVAMCPGISYPSVRRITMDAFFPFDFSSDGFAGSFPGLQELRWLHDEVEPNVAEREREDTLASRATSSVLHREMRWDSLDFLHCRTSATYSMALTCGVRLWKGAEVTEGQEWHQFRTVLADIRPSCLSVTIDVDVENLAPSQVTSIFPESNITHLKIQIRIDHVDIDVRELLVSGIP